jgi:hypothetical protein
MSPNAMLMIYSLLYADQGRAQSERQTQEYQGSSSLT